MTVELPQVNEVLDAVPFDDEAFARLESAVYGVAYSLWSKWHWRTAIEIGYVKKAIVNGKIVGCIAALPMKTGELYIDELVVAEKSWKQGIGTALLESVLEQSSGRIVLHTMFRIDNLWVMEFYRKHGFEDAGVINDFYEKGKPCLKMVRPAP